MMANLDQSPTTGWLIVRATTDATAETVIEFTKGNTVHFFGPSKTIVSNNAVFFKAVNFSKFMNECSTD